jgi:hypothetical protein
MIIAKLLDVCRRHRQMVEPDENPKFVPMTLGVRQQSAERKE